MELNQKSQKRKIVYLGIDSEIPLDILREKGIDPAKALSEKELHALCRKEDVSLVLLDGDQQGIDGYRVLRDIKSNLPDLPVIVIAEKPSVEKAVEAMREGASDFLLKPISEEKMVAALNRHMRFNSSDKTDKSIGNPESPVPGKILTSDKKFLEIIRLCESVAPSKATILIQGESGTGKELLARYIHACSGRENRPFVALNCAALPENLAESELFGYEKGAFTGAMKRKIGKFELADKGTLLLDEISELPLPLQAKLLRALQENEIDRIAGTAPVSVDVRVIAVSNVPLTEAVKKGAFREDLYFRLNVISFTIPPLRERKGDIRLLAEHFLKTYSKMNNKPFSGISAKALPLLEHHLWKGNIRELENTIHRGVLIGDGNLLKPEHLLLEESIPPPGYDDITIRAGMSVRDMEEKLIMKTLEDVNNNRTHAAEMLGISIRTLRNKLKEYKEANPDIRL